MNIEIPLYKQIVYQIENSVLLEELQPGGKISSVCTLEYIRMQ